MEDWWFSFLAHKQKYHIMDRKILLLTLMFTYSILCIHGQKVDMSLFHGIKPRNIGPAGQSGRVTAIAADPRNPDIMYIGTASGGLWKTLNAGTTFTPVFDDQPVASIGALAVDPLRPDIVWAGTGEGNPRNSVTGGYGIYKSLDAGKTWKLSGLQETRHIHRIIVNPYNSDIVYAGAIGSPWGPSEERGLFKTIDGGQTWQKILYNGETVGVADMVMDPTNPDKIFVAMWNHQRWPWFFNSGGPGSGLYLTLDGGKNFTRVTKGLPDDVGRIGVAIARSRPDYVYAYVESKPNAIYRSTDGGMTWEKRAEKNIGTRPFYFAEIYVDPMNENRLYTLFSGINMSEDGGITFPAPVAGTIHLDHHAWWINPANPAHMVDGNDGGMAITYDRGKTWRHITNLPVGQFYHINVDDEMPYRVYGGMQDNGSWVGPAYAWYEGGIINEFWDFLDGGDGFNAMAVPGDPRFCYCQSQGGALKRIDLLTGSGKFIRPAPENGEKLRFNWNSALAQDPFDNNTIYFGSQFVHKSINRGDKWEKISPDLTTNDQEKQNQAKSGGITIDATGAENHCTILTISPSKMQKGLIWAGTDDGNVQFTTDGGKTWINVTDNFKGAPKKAWIPQITASEYNPAEAFVVLNNYRVGDYSAYLFHTSNYGKTWQRIINDQNVWGYVLCFVQDPKEPKLMFAGTEYGLYVSFDMGVSWNRWTERYPTVSTYDMVIQKRESDLVIGTFGRSAWIIDNIEPLRELASTGSRLLDNKLKVFDTPQAVYASKKNLPGYYYRGDGMFEGDNRNIAASLTFFVSELKPEKVNVEISDTDGIVVKNIESDVIKGFNRIEWRLDKNPAPYAGQINKGNQNYEQEERMRFLRGSGIIVIPGEYRVKMSYNHSVSEGRVNVMYDPRLPVPDIKVMRENYRRADELVSRIKELNSQYQKFFDCNSLMTKIDDLSRKYMVFGDSVRSIQDTLKAKYESIDKKLTTRPDGLFSKINAIRALTSATSKLSENEEKSINEAISALMEATKLINDFLDNDWVMYRNALNRKTVPVNAVIKWP
jgi:photosystem II stability/assembly factor-like uncharacterized protein